MFLCIFASSGTAEVGSNTLNILSTKTIYECILKWVSYDAMLSHCIKAMTLQFRNG